MTNAEIIFNESIDLMNQGIIGTTGRQITVLDVNGEERRINEPEPIHTFASWKTLGRKVKHGERAKAKIRIWKPSKTPYMRDAFFFTYSQTEAN